MPRTRYTRAILIIATVTGLLACLSFFPGTSRDHVSHSKIRGVATRRRGSDTSSHYKVNEKRVKRVRNETLGFEKVFVVNLPERGDKLDAFTLASSLTGFVAEPMVGIRGDGVSGKSLPNLDKMPSKVELRQNMIGNWRSHLNFARRIIADGLSSALVMEDDADWSIYLKDQLSIFAIASQYILGTSPKRPFNSPYGDTWDLLWLGHCGTSMRSDDERRFVVSNDHTVPLPSHRAVYAGEYVNITQEGYDERTRAVFEVRSGQCTYAYALSSAGAKKVLHFNGIQTEFQAIDAGLGAMCRSETANFRCLSVFPTLVDTHKPAGSKAGDSDISPAGKEEVRERGHTWNVLHSQRMNVDRMLDHEALGDGREWRQWKEEPVVEGPPVMRMMSRHPTGSEVLIEATGDGATAETSLAEKDHDKGKDEADGREDGRKSKRPEKGAEKEAPPDNIKVAKGKQTNVDERSRKAAEKDVARGGAA